MLKINNYKNAIILPNTNMNGGVYTDNSFIFNTSLHRNWIKKFPEKVEPRTIRHEKVVYIGMFHDVWGHCITDCLKHLWIMNDPNHDDLKNLKFVYLTVYPDFKFFDNFKKLFLMLGIDVSKIELIAESTQFDEVFIPEECFYLDEKDYKYHFTKEYADLINKITLDVFPDSSNEKVYFSRTKIKTHKEIGEIYIENTMTNAGYKIFYPEQLTFEQQIAVLKGCKYFAATEGSISHNIIFCSDSCHVLILQKNSGKMNSYQECLNTLKNFRVTNLNVSKSVLNNKRQPWTGPFFIYATKELTDFLHVSSRRFPLIPFIFGYICGNIPSVLKRFIKQLLGR